MTLNATPNAQSAAYAQLLAEGSCFAHTCGPVPDLGGRALHADYTGWIAVGENIAAGQQTAERAVQQWMNSPQHRANLLDPRFNEMGVAKAIGPGQYGVYWVQTFGQRAAAGSVPQLAPPSAATSQSSPGVPIAQVDTAGQAQPLSTIPPLPTNFGIPPLPPNFGIPPLPANFGVPPLPTDTGAQLLFIDPLTGLPVEVWTGGQVIPLPGLVPLIPGMVPVR